MPPENVKSVDTAKDHPIEHYLLLPTMNGEWLIGIWM
jgi:hypothetical protein